MSIGPMELLLIIFMLTVPLLVIAGIFMLTRRARKQDSPEEQARIRELERRVQELERQR